jgi:co-chaperonin GroES (HSP10)
MLEGLIVPGPWCLILPLYEAEKIGHIVIPDGLENPIAQQGLIVRAGKTSIFRDGDRVLLQPYQGTTFTINGVEYFRYLDTHIIARVIDRVIKPKPLEVVILPEFRQTVDKPGLIHIVQDLYFTDPQRYGRVVAVGRECNEVQLGDRVMLPDFGGYEVGWIDTVYYIIREEELLAICNLP